MKKIFFILIACTLTVSVCAEKYQRVVTREKIEESDRQFRDKDGIKGVDFKDYWDADNSHHTKQTDKDKTKGKTPETDTTPECEEEGGTET